MRPLHLMDLDAATRAMLACDADQRADLAARLVQEAESADRYRKRLRRVHPQFGTGTLRSAAQGYPQHRLPQYCNADYLHCLHLVLKILRAKAPIAISDL